MTTSEDKTFKFWYSVVQFIFVCIVAYVLGRNFVWHQVPEASGFVTWVIVFGLLQMAEWVWAGVVLVLGLLAAALFS